MGKRRRIDFSPDAQRHLDGIREWRKEAKREAGRLLRELKRCLRRLSAFPASSERRGETLRNTVIHSYSVTYHVVYALEPGSVVVVGLVDSRAAEQLEHVARRWRAP